MAAKSSTCRETLLSDMVSELKEVDWHTLGTHLHVPQHKLNNIKQDKTSPDRQLTEMLSYCLNNGDMNWQKIIQALEKIGCHANIIIIIQAKYITPGQHQSQAISFNRDISALSNTRLITSDAGAISAGTESEQALCRATGDEQVVAKRMCIDQKSCNVDGTKEVEISGERYILGVAPEANSVVVAEAKKKLLGRVDLKTLVDDLGHTGSFIRVAYNGVMAAGPQYTKLQIEIQDLGFDVTDLCNESALTVFKFETASATVLTNLEIIYDLLLRNQETVAIEILSTTSTLAGKMEEAANALQDKFKKEEEKVKNTLEKVQTARGEEAIRIKLKEEEHQQLEIQLQHQQKLLDDAQRLEQEAEAQRWQIEAKENEAISGMKHIGPLKSIVNAMFGYEVFDKGTKKLRRWREKRIQAIENERKLRKERYEAMETLTSFAVKLQNCQSEREMAEVTEDALHKTIGVLKQLIQVFKRAATFWRRMQEQCRSLADDGMKAKVKSISNTLTKEERMTLWTSENFKKQAVRFHADWVALNNLSSEYAELIHKTQTDLYEHMVENPTYEESRKNVQVLAKEFLTYLRKRREIMAQRDSKDQEEINGLASKQD